MLRFRGIEYSLILLMLFVIGFYRLAYIQKGVYIKGRSTTPRRFQNISYINPSPDILEHTSRPLLSESEAFGTCDGSKNNMMPMEEWDSYDADWYKNHTDAWRKYMSGPLIDYDSVASDFKGRGIVLVIGPFTTTLWQTRVNLRIIRATGCNLPVEIHYFENEYKSLEHIKHFFTEFEHVSYHNLSDPNTNIAPAQRIIAGYGGSGQYHLKVLGVLNSRFEELLLLDGDVGVVNDPTSLFEHPAYLDTGALFWPDVWKSQGRCPIWRVINQPCDISEFEQESGAIVLNKRKSWEPLQLSAFFATVLVDLTPHVILGDKEMFRLAWRAIGRKYHMIQTWITSIGTMWDGEYCGHTFLQHHPDGAPLFVHSGLLKLFSPNSLDYFRNHNRTGIFTHYMRSPHNNLSDVKCAVSFIERQDTFTPGNKPTVCIIFSQTHDGPPVEFGRSEKIIGDYEHTFDESGGYWPIDMEKYKIAVFLDQSHRYRSISLQY